MTCVSDKYFIGDIFGILTREKEEELIMRTSSPESNQQRKNL